MKKIIRHGREISRIEILPDLRGQLTSDEQADFQIDVRVVICGDHKFHIVWPNDAMGL